MRLQLNAEPWIEFIAGGNDGGAPTKYKKEYAAQAYRLCLLGFTDRELAAFFEVAVESIDNWKIAHKEFFRSLKAGKTIADSKVAESLFKRANGYEYTETTFEKDRCQPNAEKNNADDLQDSDTCKKKVVTKHLPPYNCCLKVAKLPTKGQVARSANPRVLNDVRSAARCHHC